MKGLELARLYYEEYGARMIREEFPELEGVLAIGLAGAGSECFGYDDELSHDHDFEPGFCIFVPDNVTDRKTLFRLERAYASLPKQFLGYERERIAPAGGSRRGVIMAGDFFEARTGRRDGALTARELMRTPEHYLAEATNGAVFRDDAGEFTAARELLSNVPRDVKMKKLAGHLFLMAQSGQYNYPRAVKRGDSMAAQLALFEFVRHAMGARFALAGKYMPFYKWLGRAFSELPGADGTKDALEYLITTDNDEKTSRVKAEVIGDIARMMSDELRSLSLSDDPTSDLDRHAFRCNDRIADADTRGLSVLYAVD